MVITRASFDLLSFDCYGTLVDWETGIYRAVQDLSLKQGQKEPSRAVALTAFSQAESEIEQRANAGDFLSYREILQRVFARMTSSWGWPRPTSACADFAESVKDWPLFEDTVESLQALVKDYPLYILSNIDTDLFALTQKKLKVEFAGVLTADALQSYKPAPLHFEVLLKETGIPAQRILHVAQSRFHDISPAKDLGFKTAWIDRRGEASGGATPDSDAIADFTFGDLFSLRTKV